MVEGGRIELDIIKREFEIKIHQSISGQEGVRISHSLHTDMYITALTYVVAERKLQIVAEYEKVFRERYINSVVK